MIYLRRCGFKNPKVQKRILSFILCLVMTCSYLVSTRRSVVAGSQSGYSIGYVYSSAYGYLNVRDKVGSAGSNVVDQLDNNAQITVLEQHYASDGALWYKISYFKGRTLKYGYVHSINVKFVSAADDPEFEEYLDSQNFPEGYRTYLRVLHKIRPDWVFKAFHTDIPWSEVLSEECFPDRSSIEKTVISSWKSLDLYDWENDTYSNMGGSGWTQASDEIVAFYLDPRNFLNDQQMFQFELIEYNPECHTEEAVETVLAGTFMSHKVLYEEEIVIEPEPTIEPVTTPSATPEMTGTSLVSESPVASATETEMSTSDVTETPSVTPGSTSETSPSATPEATPVQPEIQIITVTYAQAFIQVAKELDVSPCMLASRVRQEQGTEGTNPLISGTVKNYEGYYNYFNIGATGNNSQAVLENGMKEAFSEGWDSPYKALVGGARKVCSTHIKKGQDTLYLQKFDVDDTYHGRYWHQYMQNIRAASHEGVTVRNSYAQCGIVDKAFEFKIPVYTDMPVYACLQPTEDRNPNYKLSNISIIGYTISPTFRTDTLTYTVAVPYTASTVDISAIPYVSKATVSGTGIVELNEGNNVRVIRCTAENGTYREYTLNITRAAAPSPTLTPTPTATATTSANVTPSTSATNTPAVSVTPVVTETATPTPVPTPTIKPSPSHNIENQYKVNEDSYISGISENTKVQDMTTGINVSNGVVYIVDKAGNEVDSSAKVATGNKLIIKDVDGIVYEEFDLIIYGDITGDGQINALDYVYIKRHLWGISELNGIYRLSADVSPSKGSIDALDFVYMKRHLWGISDIVQ